MDNRDLVCLCYRCRQNFRDAGGYALKRACFPQETKDICTYCQTRYGFSYALEPVDLSEMPDEEDFYGDSM